MINKFAEQPVVTFSFWHFSHRVFQSQSLVNAFPNNYEINYEDLLKLKKTMRWYFRVGSNHLFIYFIVLTNISVGRFNYR